MKKFRDFTYKYSQHIFSLEELHLSENKIFRITNYDGYRTARHNLQSGGTAIFVQKLIENFVHPFNSKSFENTTIVVNSPNFKAQITSIYIPPNNCLDVKEIDALLKKHDNSIIIGDFNCKHSSWSLGNENRNGKALLEYCFDNQITMIFHPNPTRFGPYLNSTVDFALMNTPRPDISKLIL